MGVKEVDGRCCPSVCVRTVLRLLLTLLACGTDVPIAAQRHIDALPSIPGVADRTGHVCQAHWSRQGLTIGQLDCVAQSGLVGSGLESRLMHILAPGGLTLRKGGSVCRSMSLRLGLLQREWSHLVWPRAGLAWQLHVDDIAGHRCTSRRPMLSGFLDN